MEDERELDLEPGDFLYQADQELFLVVMREQEDSYLFSVHGWRDIDKNRVDEYVENDHSKLYGKDYIDDVIEEDAPEESEKNYERLLELFEQYAKDFEDEGPHTDFALEDKP